MIHALWNLLAKRAGGGAALVWLYGTVSAVLLTPFAALILIRRPYLWPTGLKYTLALALLALLPRSDPAASGLSYAAILRSLSNQSRIYAVRPEARSRMNTAYMVAYFVGGAAGSSGGAWGWGRAGWAGVCLAGLGMSAAGLLAFVATAPGAAPARPGPGVEA